MSTLTFGSAFAFACALEDESFALPFVSFMLTFISMSVCSIYLANGFTRDENFHLNEWKVEKNKEYRLKDRIEYLCEELGQPNPDYQPLADYA